MQSTPALKQEILNLEKKYWQALKDQDLETALELTNFPCVVAGAHGFRSVDREEYIKMFESNQESIQSFEFEDDKFEVQQLTPDTVISAYQLQSSFSQNGKPIDIHAVDTSTWIKRNDKWVCAMHTETELT